MARTVSSSAFFWERVRLNLRSWLLGSLVGTLMLSAIIWIAFIKPQSDLRDVTDAPLRQSVGIITSIQPGFADQTGGISPGHVFIMLETAPPTPSIDIPLNSKPMQIGQRVQVSYRLGKSGRIYIIDAEPIGR